jgi:hypothetical protein
LPAHLALPHHDHHAPIVAPADLPRAYGRALLIGIGASMVVLAVLMHAAGLSIDPLAAGNRPFCIAGAVALMLRLGAWRLPWRHGRALAQGAEYYALFTIVALAGAVASYPIAALTHGFHDAALQRIDAALGFHWLAWYETVAAHPWLQRIGVVVYRSIYLTPAILLGHFAWTGDRVAAQRFLATFWATAIGTLALYAFMPAIGPFSYLWHGAIPYMPESEQWQQGLIPALRDGRERVVDLAHLRGIVSAPSFHTAAAAIYIAAAWPIRSLRWPVLALNAAMLLSTPVEGTHYLADMLLGTAVAVVAILILRRLMPDGSALGAR